MGAELFYRHGAPYLHSNPTLIDGKPCVVSPKPCGRCGGAGRSDKWAYTGYTCFDCNGAGTRGTQIDRLYTADQLAKLNATQAKRNATRQAKADAERLARETEADARRNQFQCAHSDLLAWLRPRATDSDGNYIPGFLGSLMRQADIKADWSENQVTALREAMQRDVAREIVKAASRHVGTIGERLEGKVTVERVSAFERHAFGRYGTEVCYIVSMRDADGNALVVKSPNAYGFEKGETYQIRGTVKAHESYKGECQTVLQRVTRL